MGIIVIWDDDEKTRLRHLYSGHVDSGELFAAIEVSTLFLDCVYYPVNLIVDMQGDLDSSGMISPISSLRIRAHPNLNRVVFVGKSQYTKKMRGVFQKLQRRMGDKVAFVATLAEARALLNVSHERTTASHNIFPDIVAV
jgi:hypothetical protein